MNRSELLVFEQIKKTPNDLEKVHHTLLYIMYVVKSIAYQIIINTFLLMSHIFYSQTKICSVH